MISFISEFSFVKYHGAGNDFVCIDDREALFAPYEQKNIIAKLCDRRFGIGADGIILLRLAAAEVSDASLKMVYYNSDGAASSFCGNGSRCFVRFAADLGLVNALPLALSRPAFQFEAADGLHHAILLGDEGVRVTMLLAGGITRYTSNADIVDTGSPHYIEWCERLPTGDIVAAARTVRYSPAFAKTGININYATVSQKSDETLSLQLRTYERGVEDETLACGTGVTAAAISFAERRQLIGKQCIRVEALGGSLAVYFEREPSGNVKDVWLEGPTKLVFKGTIVL